MIEVGEVATPSGTARVHLHRVPRGRSRATLVLGHGAGRGVDAPELAAIAATLPAEGIEVALVEQPWRVAGRRVAGRPATLDAAWLAVVAELASAGLDPRRAVFGGRSAGARVACRTLADQKPAALLLLAFPLHGVGRADPAQRRPSRLPELLEAARAVPTVVVQGTADRMGSADEVALALAEAGVAADVVPIPWADHGFATPSRAPQPPGWAIARVVEAARAVVLRAVDARA